MDFYDLRPVGDAGNKPTIKTTDKSVLVTIPNHLLQSAGLSGAGKVRVRFGESGKTKAIRITACTDEGWGLTARKNVAQIFVRARVFSERPVHAPYPTSPIPFEVRTRNP